MFMRIANPFDGLEEIITENAPLAPFTWYRIGGPAKYLVQPRSVEELVEAAKRCSENEIPIYVLGLGANLLVADEGVEGAVFRLDQEFWRTVKITGSKLEVGAGADMQKLLLRTVRAGLAGIECLAGIPGTVGGTPVQNVGAYGQEVSQTIVRVRAFLVSAMSWMWPWQLWQPTPLAIWISWLKYT